MKRLLFLVPLLVAQIASADQVDDYVKAEMARNHIPGLTIGIIRDGKLAESRAYGKADLEVDAPMKEDSLMEIGSITKQFTAACVLKLIEDGKVSLEDPISKFVPEVKDNWKGVTIRHMLYQISGLPEYALIAGIGLTDTYDRKRFLDTLTPLPLDFAPGAAWSYSNTNYALLGYVIEKAAGVSYAQYVTDNVFKPAGMSNTHFLDVNEIVPGRAHGYFMNDGNLVILHGSASILSDGAIITNVQDMAKWDAALGKGMLLKPESYKLMWSPAKLNSGHTRPYGTGWDLPTHGTTPFMGHGGNSVGYSAGFIRFPGSKLSVVVMGNVYAFSGEGMARSIAEILEPSLKNPIPTEAAADPDPDRTARVRLIIDAIVARKPDDELLETDVTAPMKTSRASAFPAFQQFKKMDHFGFVSAEPEGPDTWLTYRVQASGRWYTFRILYSAKGRAAQVAATADPAPTKA